ncbi:MAG TPA: hypothetical protein VD789_05665 [Thermomicrobiales bacterium]|nr:hypothetical protein [Thermomicrobiales bacterium]
MTIIIDLNLDLPRTETLRFDSAPLDTVMVISARQDHRRTPKAAPQAQRPTQLTLVTAPAEDEEITWEDAEWQ